VESIVYARLGARHQGQDEISWRIKDAVGFFRFLHDQQTGLERRLTLAELLDWLDYLMPQHTPVSEWYALANLTESGKGTGDAMLRASIEDLLLRFPGDQDWIDKLLKDCAKTGTTVPPLSADSRS